GSGAQVLYNTPNGFGPSLGGGYVYVTTTASTGTSAVVGISVQSGMVAFSYSVNSAVRLLGVPGGVYYLTRPPAASAAVGWIPVGGTGAARLATPGLLPVDLAVDADSLYWTEQGTDGTIDGHVQRVPRNGTVATQLATGPGGCSGIAIDDRFVYFTSPGN